MGRWLCVKYTCILFFLFICFIYVNCMHSLCVLFLEAAMNIRNLGETARLHYPTLLKFYSTSSKTESAWETGRQNPPFQWRLNTKAGANYDQAVELEEQLLNLPIFRNNYCIACLKSHGHPSDKVKVGAKQIRNQQKVCVEGFCNWFCSWLT